MGWGVFVDSDEAKDRVKNVEKSIKSAARREKRP